MQNIPIAICYPVIVSPLDAGKNGIEMQKLQREKSLNMFPDKRCLHLARERAVQNILQDPNDSRIRLYVLVNRVEVCSINDHHRKTIIVSYVGCKKTGVEILIQPKGKIMLPRALCE
jgi:hypothetical protein